MTDQNLIDPRLRAKNNTFIIQNPYYGPGPSEQQILSAQQEGELLHKDNNFLDCNFQYEAMASPEFETSAPSSPGISISNPDDQVQHPCLKPGCNKLFTHLHKLQRHYRDAHGKPQYDCPYPGCSRKGQKGFARKDNMTQHHRLVHNKQLDPGTIPRRKRVSSN
ncbi:hypothetical protein DFP73DRAFT_628008 [Morchella snyderi]|nr:hypothetical protein DFP73DRAFT_628008 [Morchella snyderi]